MRSVKNIIQKLSDLYKGSHPLWVALVALSLCAVIGVASAFFHFASGYMQMKLGMNNFEVIGNSSSNKDAGVKNNTGRDAYVRAYIVPCWQQTDEDGNIIGDNDYLGYTEWDITEKINSGYLVLNDADWRKDGNYYYYKKVLSANASTTALVNSFSGESTFISQRMSQYNPKITLPNDLSNNGYNKNYVYPHLKVFDYVDRSETVVKPFEQTHDLAAIQELDYAGGTGTDADPFLIKTGEQLLKCVTSSGVAENGAKLHFRLASDIYLNTYNENGKPITYDRWFYSRDKKSRFCGCFDGNGYTVNGLYINYDYNDDFVVNGNDNVSTSTQDKTFGGLFPCLGPGAEIRNLGIIEATLWDLPYSGAIAGYVCARSADDEPIIIENCFVQNMRDSSGLNSHTEVDGDAVGGLVGYAELASTTTSGEPLLQISNFYVNTRFDIWGKDANNNMVEATTARPRTATVGASNNPSNISIKSGYLYLNTEDNSSASADDTWNDRILMAPAGAKVAANVFSHLKTSNMVANYNTIKDSLSSVTNDMGTDYIWSFSKINESSLYPKDGLLVSTEFYRAQTDPYGQMPSKYLAKQAYKVVYELLQADGTTDDGSKTSIYDAWYTEADFVENSDEQTLKGNFDFYSATGNCFYQNDMQDFYNPNTVYLASLGNLQSTLSGTNYARVQINFYTSGTRKVWQTYNDLIAENGFLDKISTPYVSYTVFAEKAGTYKIAPEFVVDSTISDKSKLFFVVSVNDKDYYRNNFATVSGNYSANPIEVKLEEGVNIVRVICTKELSAYCGTEGGKWINHNGIWIEKSSDLTVKKPISTYINYADSELALDENGNQKYKTDADGNFVLDGNGKKIPLYNTMTYVASKNYNNDNGQDCLNNGISAYMNSNLITMENLNSKTLQHAPYSSIQINNTGSDGFYDISLSFNTKTDTGVGASGYIVVRVNGVNYRRYFNVADGTQKAPLNISAYLKNGLNNITITAPLETTSPESGYLGYVSWFNQWGINITGDGSVTMTSDKTFDPYLEDPDAAYVVPPHISLLEAEIYATANRYGQVESSGGATVIGGIEPWYSQLPDWSAMPTNSFVERSETYYLNDNVSPHVDYTVYSPADGTYKIKPRFYIVFENNQYFDGCCYFLMVNEKFKKIPIAESELDEINGRYWYQSELEVNLKKGVNVIRFISVDSNTSFTKQVKDAQGNTVSTENRGYGIEWFNHDYLELVSDPLIGVKPQAELRGGIQAHYTYSYNGSKYNIDATNSTLVGYNRGEGDYGNVSDLFTRYQLKWIGGGKLDTTMTPENITLDSVSNTQFGSLNNGLPAISHTVKVPTEGYYSLTLAAACNTNLHKHKLAVFVNNGNDTVNNGVITQKRKYIVDFMGMRNDSPLECRIDCSVYLEKGINTITITCPVDSQFITDINNTAEWFNIGGLRVTGGVEFAPYHSRVNPIQKWGTRGYNAGSGQSWIDLLGKAPNS